MGRTYYVYIMASPSRAIYVGMTSRLEGRMGEHKGKQFLKSHTRKYNEVMLVHIEEHPDPWSAIEREKQVKGWDRAKKVALIEAENPDWLDLSAGW